jgi:hypothetical protein
MQTVGIHEYPLQFSVDYPEEPRNRLTVAFRIFLIFPIMIVLGLIERTAFTWSDSMETTRTFTAATGGLLFLPPLVMILFRRKYPRWWFNWNLELMRFISRIVAYALLLRDEYPSTDEEQAVHLDIPYPDAARDLNRWFPLVKWLLAIPHYIVLIVLSIAAFFVAIVAWFAILITGRYPRGLFDFVVDVERWQNRVTSYAITLMTDEYPPFRFGP